MMETAIREAKERNELLDVTQAAAYLNTSKRHIRRLRSEKRIPYTKIGAKLRFRREALDNYIADNSFDSVPDFFNEVQA